MADGNGYEYDEEYTINYKSITCERIPELFLDKLVAKKHFSKFGKINRFILRPSRLCCTVDYESEKDAANAYAKAASYNGHDFIINYAEKEVGHVQNTEEWVDPDVQSELDAMGHRNSNAVASQLRHTLMKPPPMVQRVVKQSFPRPTKSTVTPSAQAPDQPQLPKMDASVRMELETLLRKPAHTDEEKYRVLDARDKLIRLTTVRQTDIKKAVSTIGICPDMCPEKERLMREFQRQVSVFEMNNLSSNSSSIDNRRAIKEYSRSSADQEVPLAHELRPESVLQMTMLYLMQSVMDLCEDPQVSIADWFHFVWDRTRSIRKDITQQELCSLGAVELVEQCARFHIHCAARLVAEDPAVFDKKINAENLTKCLQTLKYMYHDLRIKQIHCPCEPEFRGYIVLLNLGDANFLWELKQLPEEIQRSAHIKRAIAFYNALQNNNYVRFFKMVKAPETPYLSSCILLGYFTKLRLKAMEAIVKSYTWRKHPSWLPLAYLAQVLGFEDEAAAIDFFSAHGLQYHEGRVKLDRLQMPDIDYSMDRAMLLVERKRTVSVGECVCGHPLESSYDFDNHQPHNSFDSNGLLKPEAWTADDQLRGKAAAGKRLKSTQQSQEQVPPSTLPQQTQTPPSICITDNIFKVPLATPPVSSKQLQQSVTNKSTLPGASIFGGNFYAGDSHKPAVIHASANFVSNSNFETKDAAPVNSGASIFKIPLGSGSAAEKPTKASSATEFFNSGFTSKAVQPTTSADIFHGFTTKPSTTANTGNIFGIAAKKTANIFQNQQHQQQQFGEPKPLDRDNIFKHFETSAAPSAVTTSIFGATTTATKPNKEPNVYDLDNRKVSNEILDRKRRLEAEQSAKLAELEEERRKLKVLEEKQARLREEAEAKARLVNFHKAADSQAEELLQVLVEELIVEVAAAELAKYQAIEKRTLQLTLELIDESVLDQVKEIQNEEYALMCHDQMIMQRYFERWLQSTRKKLEQRRLMENTPIWVTSETRAQQSHQLQHPRESENLQMIKRYRLGEPCNFKLLLSPPPEGIPRSHLPLDLFQLIAQHSSRKQIIRNGIVRHRTYFKMILSLPSDREELHGFEGMCNRWLHKYVRQPPRKSDDICYINDVAYDVALCVRKLTGMLPTNEAGQRVNAGHESDNADAIIFLMTGDNLRNTRCRLHHLLKLSKLYKPLPIGFVIYNSTVDEHTTASCLDMDHFMGEGKVSNFMFFGCQDSKKSFSFYNNFKHAVRFVASESSFNNSESEALEMQKLPSWLEEALGEAMWHRWLESSLQNPVFNKICTMPRFVVVLYNDAVQRLEEIVGEDMAEAPELPSELRQFVPPLKYDIPHGLEYFPDNWKNAHRREKLLDFLSRTKLAPLSEQQLRLDADINDLQLSLLDYASQCIPDDEEAATEAAYQAIKTLIEALNAEDVRTLELGERLSIVCWLPVVKQLAFARIKQVLHEMCSTLPAEVIYQRQAFSDYQHLPWWLNIQPVSAVTMDHTRVEEPSDNADANEDDADDIEAIIEQAEAVSRKAEQNLLALKQQNSKTLNDELTRTLDESFYQFDLAKNCGTFNNILPKDEDSDNQLLDEECDLLDASPKEISPLRRKRKLDESSSDVEEVMAKAFALIEQIETTQDLVRAQRVIVEDTDF